MEVFDKRISEVPLLNVSPVIIFVVQTVPVPVKVQRPLPNVSVRVFVLLLENVVHVTLYVLPLKVPFDKVKLPFNVVLLAKVTVPLGAPITTPEPGNVLLAVSKVTALLLLNVNAPLPNQATVTATLALFMNPP